MQENRIGSLELLSYFRFEAYRNVTNIVTTRTGGRSTGNYKSLNLGLHVGDDPNTVLENRALLAQGLAIEPESFTLAEQIHKTKISVVKANHLGRGAVVVGDALSRSDALVSNVPDIPMMILVADCVAVSVYDPTQQAVGLIHAGWRGTVARIVESVINKMELAYESDPKELVVGLSPAIGKGHYEVGEEVLTAYRDAFGREVTSQYIQEDMDGTCYLDLWGVNQWQLEECGVLAENIEVSKLCTACHPERFYSHRHDGGKTGRFGNLVMLHSSSQRQY